MATTNDRRALAAFLNSIDGADIVALPPDSSRYTQEDGHGDAAEVAAERGLAEGSFGVVFWHQQSAERAFDRSGRLVAPLLLHWAGDRDRVLAGLSALPDPYEAWDFGEDTAFEIRLPGLEDWAGHLPDPTETDDVLARILWMRDSEHEWSDDEWAWVNRIVREGAPKARARLVDRLLWQGDHLEVETLSALLADFVLVYKADEGMDPMRLLQLLQRRGDQRYDDVLAECLRQRGWVFRYAAAQALGEFGGEADIPTLYKLATAKARQPSPIAANPRAIEAWLKLRSVAEDRSVADVADEALADLKFDEPARRKLAELAAQDRR